MSEIKGCQRSLDYDMRDVSLVRVLSFTSCVCLWHDTSTLNPVFSVFKCKSIRGSKAEATRTCLVVQWLRLCAPKAGGLGLIPHATTKTWCS